MFGYVTVNKEELKIKDYNYYRSCYCGLCHMLKKRHGLVAPLTLSYDMTFLLLVLSGLYEEEFTKELHRCAIHPMKKHEIRYNKWTEYAADMTILLAYHNCMDDWKDERKVMKLTTAKSLEHSYKKIAHAYPKKAEEVEDYIRQMNHCEKTKSKNLDEVAGLTGIALGAIFCNSDKVWKESLTKMGFYLGKFIYLMDAYEDREEDKKKGNYNPLLELDVKDDFEAYIENSLVMMMADCAREFEMLPILQHVDILRNILYSGVWEKYERIKAKKNEKGEKTDEF